MSSWRVLVGKSPDELKRIKTVIKTGFEAQISVKNQGPYFQIKAVNAKDKITGTFSILRL